jgi:lysophospholipase L1-like esterase
VRGAALGLGLASLALSLLAAELWVRVFQPAPFTGYGHVPPHRRFFRYDETLGWSGRPLARGRFADRDFDVEVSLDALGHRRAGPVARPGRANLLALGDSEGWGWGVEDDEVFASVMMRDDPRLNVHNLSAPGFGTDQQLLALERLLGERPDLRVDGVVVLLNANDFDDVVHDERHSYPKPRFVLRGGALELTNVPVPDTRRAGFRELSAQPRSPTSAWNRVHLHNLLVRALQRLAGPPESPPAALAGPEQGAGREGVELVGALLHEIATRARARGAACLVVVLRRDERSQAVAPALAGAGIAVSHFAPSGRLRRVRHWLDGHLNAHGHRLLARHVAGAWAEAGG